MIRTIWASIASALRAVLREETHGAVRRLAHAVRHPSDLPESLSHQLRRV